MGSSAARSLRFDGIYLPHLQSLTIAHVSFKDDPDTLLALLRSTFQYPLLKFALENCRRIPESFSIWFDPASKSDVWSQLETLSVAGMETMKGPGDDVWEEASEEERNEWDTAIEGMDIWSSSSRLALDNNCRMRGIFLDVEDFEWWEECG